MRKVVVLISDILEEVDLVFALEEPSSNAMHYGISPALKILPLAPLKPRPEVDGAYLVVEPSRGFEMVKVLRVRFTSPEVHIGNFEITPNCVSIGVVSREGNQASGESVFTYNGTGYTISRHRPRGSSSRCSWQYIEGSPSQTPSLYPRTSGLFVHIPTSQV